MRRRPFLIAAAVVAANTAAILPVVMLTRSSTAADEPVAPVTAAQSSTTAVAPDTEPAPATSTTAATTSTTVPARQRVQIESCMLVGNVGTSSVNPAGPEGAAVYGADAPGATSAECTISAAAAGSLALTLRYASISTVERDVFVNDIPLRPGLRLAPSTDGSPWAVQTVVIPVDSDENRVRIDLADVWFDWLEVAPSSSVTSTTATTTPLPTSSAAAPVTVADTAPIDFALAPDPATSTTPAAATSTLPTTRPASGTAGTTTTQTAAPTATKSLRATVSAPVTATAAAAVTAAPASVPLFTPTSATDAGTATTSGPTAAPTTRAATTTFQVTSTAAPTTAATTTAAPTTAATTTAAPTTAAPTSAAPTTAAATTTAPAAWTVVWSDEFTTGLGPDWSAVGTGAGVFDDTFGSECYAPSQVTVAGGVLQLTAQQKPVTCNGVARSWVSGLVTTRRHFSQTYGRFEARMKLPVAKGTWPAFWLMPENPTYGQWPGSGEIDVMEYVAKPLQTVFQTIHWAEAGAHKASSAAANLTTPASDWHRYAIEWEPRTVRWYVDDLLVHAYTIPSGTAPFDQPFYLILNQAVGGDWAGAPDPASYPATVSVDWVRVSKRA